MKKKLWIIALAAVIGFSMAACDALSGTDKGDDGTPGANNGSDKGGNYESGFTTIEAFEAWLSKQSANTTAAAYNVKLKGDFKNTSYKVRDILKDNSTKYVKLDLPNCIFSSFVGAFADCTSLTGIILPNNWDNIQGEIFSGCTNLTTLNIPDNITYMFGGAFSGSYITSITIGRGINDIAGHEFRWNAAFENCTSLTSVTIIGNENTSISARAFEGCINLASVTVQNGKDINGFQGCTGLTNVTIGNGVKSIADYVFSGCTGLTSVTIGSGVTSIGQGAFYNCTALTDITIPNSVTEIKAGWELSGDKGAFEKCTGLTRITLGNNISSLGRNTFNGCTSLASITIPSSVTSIGNYVFSGCTSLTSVTFEGTVSDLGNQYYNPSFPGDLRDKYLDGGPGTYTRSSGSDTWTKQ